MTHNQLLKAWRPTTYVGYWLRLRFSAKIETPRMRGVLMHWEF